jgi:hypothetical protein
VPHSSQNYRDEWDRRNKARLPHRRCTARGSSLEAKRLLRPVEAASLIRANLHQTIQIPRERKVAPNVRCPRRSGKNIPKHKAALRFGVKVVKNFCGHCFSLSSKNTGGQVQLNQRCKIQKNIVRTFSMPIPEKYVTQVTLF